MPLAPNLFARSSTNAHSAGVGSLTSRLTSCRISSVVSALSVVLQSKETDMSYKNDPRVITAKFASVCAETGEKIEKGTEMLYFPLMKKCYSLKSKEFVKFNEWVVDCSLGFAY